MTLALMTHPPLRLFFPMATTLHALLAWDPCLYYGIGAIILIAGLVTIRKTQAPHASALDKFIVLGPMFFAIPMAVFGAFHFMEAKSVAQIVPSWIPGHLFWTYFVGLCLIAGALSLATNKYVGIAAALFGIMLLLFVLLIHIPGLEHHLHDRFRWETGARDLAFSGGAFAFAAIHMNASRAKTRQRLMMVARLFIAFPILYFAVEQFLHPEYAPGVPIDKVTPTWIPGHLLWSYVIGALYIVAGPCLVLNRWTRWAACSVALAIVLVCLFVYLPIVISIPLDVANGLNYFVDTLLLGGCALALAATQRDGPERSTDPEACEKGTKYLRG